MVKRWRYAGREFVTGPRLNLVTSQEHGAEVRSSIHRVGGRILRTLIVHRLGAYVGGMM